MSSPTPTDAGRGSGARPAGEPTAVPDFVGFSPFLAPSKKGHYFPYARALHEALVARGHRSLYLGLEQSDEPTPAWIVPCIPPDFRDIAPVVSFNSLRRAAGVCTHASDGPVCFHAYEGNLPVAAVLAAAVVAHGSAAVSVFNLHWGEGLAASRFVRLFYGAYLRVLVRLSGGRLLLAAESRRTAALLSAATGLDVPVYPLYSVVRAPRQPIPWDERRHTLVVVGEPADHALLLAALRRAGVDRGQLTVVDGKWALRPPEVVAAYAALGVPVIGGTLDPDRYRDLLGGARRVVFVYSARFYKTGSSGRVLDALAVGALPVVPRHTALVDLVAGRPHEQFDFTPASLAEVLGREQREAPLEDVPPPGPDAAAGWLIERWRTAGERPVALARIRRSMALGLGRVVVEAHRVMAAWRSASHRRRAAARVAASADD